MEADVRAVAYHKFWTKVFNS